MKKDPHPTNYRYVVFQDVSCDYRFITRSTIETKDTINELINKLSVEDKKSILKIKKS